MKKPVIDETKLPEVEGIIEDADSIMSELYCEDDDDLRKDLEELQSRLRDITGKQDIQIKDYWNYYEAVSLETAARGALMPPPEKEDVTDEQIRDIVVHILDYDEAEMDWWILYLEVNTGLVNLSDYIFYPELAGLDEDASIEEIAEKILEDRK
ncbi:MAG: hypothetical protein K2L86_01050 [Lachnospiraceae bacterium]|nr:hypothetical protein [Lachnospiraceae bacterium]